MAPEERRFANEIRHGAGFMNTNGEFYVIVNEPEDSDVENVVYEHQATGTRETKPRSVVETWLQSGYWKERAPIDKERLR